MADDVDDIGKAVVVDDFNTELCEVAFSLADALSLCVEWLLANLLSFSSLLFLVGLEAAAAEVTVEVVVVVLLVVLLLLLLLSGLGNAYTDLKTKIIFNKPID